MDHNHRDRGRAFVMAFSPTHGFGVDELHPDDGFIAGYRFAFDDFEPAAEQVFEIYACCGDGRPSPMRIGFRVPSVDWTV